MINREMKKILSLLFLFFLLYACRSGNDAASGDNGRQVRPVAAKKTSTLLEPAAGLSLAAGEDIPLRLEVPDTVQLDSVQLFLDGKLLFTLVAGSGFRSGEAVEALIPTAGFKLGKKSLRMKLFFPGGSSENQVRSIFLLAGTEATQYTYRVEKIYVHDVKAFTQGLQYVDGWLYEGTGDYGSSSLRKVELESGKVEKVRDLDSQLFGEGITVLGERIYQLTYKSQVGFIYDKESFEELQKIYYQNKEGWGLTHNGSELIMSDGTHVIYFLDPEMFTVNRQIEVYDHKGRADSLNELEYIDGKIWANRYYSDEIVIIDPETGTVEGRINLKGLLKAEDRKPSTDVLNGIAWDAEGKRLFVTGKRWPKLFHISLREVK